MKLWTLDHWFWKVREMVPTVQHQQDVAVESFQSCPRQCSLSLKWELVPNKYHRQAGRSIWENLQVWRRTGALAGNRFSWLTAVGSCWTHTRVILQFLRQEWCVWPASPHQLMIMWCSTLQNSGFQCCKTGKKLNVNVMKVLLFFCFWNLRNYCIFLPQYGHFLQEEWKEKKGILCSDCKQIPDSWVCERKKGKECSWVCLSLWIAVMLPSRWGMGHNRLCEKWL